MGSMLNKKNTISYDPSIKILAQNQLPQQGKFKVVCMSDTHLLQPKIGSTTDLLIHAGDFLNYDSSKTQLSFMQNYFKNLNIPDIILVAGNHDRLFDSNKSASAKKDKEDFIQEINKTTHLVYLENQMTYFKNYKIYGCPNTISRRTGAGGFQVKTPQDLEQILQNIPKDIDILITHCPPYGIGDIAKNAHQGSPFLRQLVELIKPKYHIFGHIHEARGIYQCKDTIFINASIYDKNKKINHSPFEFFLPEKINP